MPTPLQNLHLIFLIKRGVGHAPPFKICTCFFEFEGGGWEHAHPPLKFALCFFEFEGGKACV